jgi:uncharacterized RDD family membrane protein YckC
MGEVYEAEHTGTGRRLALKVLRSRLQNADDRARFLREGQLAASVSHPHTVYIFGSEEISGMPVISMELLPGGTLKDRVAAQGPLPVTDAVSAVLDIIGGLDAAQSAGILHRDIKPSNCFVDSDGAVKVGDFGLSISTLARDVHHELESGAFQGTPQFAPPEQLRGEPLDVRADIYAVGATLYYLLTGQPPFDARDLRDLFSRVTTEIPKSPRLVRPDIHPGLASVVLRCLAKTPAQRPASYAVLADALRPFSSHDDEPAHPGWRVLANVADSLLWAAPVSLWQLWVIGPRAMSETTNPAIVSPWVWLLSLAYFVFFEGLWGASPGKRLFGLRVTAEDGAPASWPRIIGRTAIFFIPSLLYTLAVLINASLPALRAGTAGIVDVLTADVSDTLWRSMASLLPILLLFATARRDKGWAGLHDLASRTRVVARVAVGGRRDTLPTVGAQAFADANGTTRQRRCGPFVVVSDAGSTGAGRLLVGFDPILRRHVWIHAVTSDTAPTSAARRDASREGRLHWLTGKRAADDSWDAFEAPNGEPFLKPERSAHAWRTVKLWLLDLASELTASVRDGTTPALGLDRLWLRGNGHLVVLDFPAPGIDAAQAREQASLTPVGLLSAVAARSLSLAAPGEGPTLIPLRARALINAWSDRTPPTLQHAHESLVRVAAIPDHSVRWRRAIPIAIGSVPTLVMLVVTLVALPALFGFMARNVEMLRLLESVHNPNARNRMTDPVIRDAAERYLAGRYRALLDDDSFWNSPPLRGLQDRRRTAREILARHPSVSAEELARVSALIAPELQGGRRDRAEVESGGGFGAVGGPIILALTAMTLLLVLGCSALSSLIVPGGVMARALGLAVVTSDGSEINRLRSLTRVLVAWLPAIVWLGYLASSPKIQGWVPNPPSPLLGTGIALALMSTGAMWAIARPARGLHDWISGTWVVQR